MGACASCMGGSPSASREPSTKSRDVSSRQRSRAARAAQQSRHGNVSARGMTPPPPDFGVGAIYTVLEMLGEGGTGQTWMCQHNTTARRLAIKFIPRPLAKVLVPMVSGEIQLQAQLSEGHLGLVHVESVLLTRTHLGIVMEYVDGGTLTQHVSRRAAAAGRGGLHLPEDEARYFFRQLISAVEYLHKQHVAHRDLKMCNVVLTNRRPPALKLCDFGFAKGWEEDSHMNTRIGTPVYMSPQLIASARDGKAYSATASDVWACGVMLFAMLLGMFPYDHENHTNPNSSGAHVEVWMEQMRVGGGNWQEAPRVAAHVGALSEGCRDLLDKVLELDEKKRLNVTAIRAHPWFASPLPAHFEETIKEIESRQALIEAALGAAPPSRIKKRSAAIAALVALASTTADAEDAAAADKDKDKDKDKSTGTGDKDAAAGAKAAADGGVDGKPAANGGGADAGAPKEGAEAEAKEEGAAPVEVAAKEEAAEAPSGAAAAAAAPAAADGGDAPPAAASPAASPFAAAAAVPPPSDSSRPLTVLPGDDAHRSHPASPRDNAAAAASANGKPSSISRTLTIGAAAAAAAAAEAVVVEKALAEASKGAASPGTRLSVPGAKWVGPPGGEILVVDLAVVAPRTKSGVLLPDKLSDEDEEDDDEDDTADGSGAIVGRGMRGREETVTGGTEAPTVLQALAAAAAEAAAEAEAERASREKAAADGEGGTEAVVEATQVEVAVAAEGEQAPPAPAAPAAPEAASA